MFGGVQDGEVEGEAVVKRKVIQAFAIIGGVCGSGGVVAGRHVFPWVEVRKTEAFEGDDLIITSYYESPKTCQCGVVKEATFRESGA